MTSGGRTRYCAQGIECPVPRIRIPASVPAAALAAAACLCVAGSACALTEPETPAPAAAATDTASTDAANSRADKKSDERSAKKENAAAEDKLTSVATPQQVLQGETRSPSDRPSSDPQADAGHKPAEGSRGFIVIDPGHGGRDGGARGGAGTNEKDIVLDVARRAAGLLRRKGVKVRLTREDDRYLSPEARAKLSNAAAPDAFLSLHANSYTGSRASGVETWVAEPRFAPSTGAFTRSRKLAQAVQSALVKTMRARDRGVREGAFIVLRDAKVPAALAEIGFLSNRKEEAKLADPVWRARIAAAVSKAVLDSGVLVPQKK